MSVTVEHRVRLTFEGADPFEMACRENEDVVSAGLRQGVLLVSDCREGVCGACRAFLQDGQYDRLLDHSPHALSERDEEEGWVLTCRLMPRSDLDLDFDYPADRVTRLEAGRRSGRIVELERRSSSIVRIVVRTLSVQEPLCWEPGQYVRLHLSNPEITRAYSIANVAGRGHELEFFIRLVSGGGFSAALENTLRVGSLVVVEGPFGTFTLKPAPGLSIFIAGGTGLVPILSMLRKLAVDEPNRPATLIFGVTSEDEMFAQAELRAITSACPRLETCVTVAVPSASWAGERGTATDALVRTMTKLRDPKGSHYYVCGPSPMVEAASTVMERFNVPPSAIHCENFVASGGLI